MEYFKVKPYEEFTREEKQVSQELWVEVLNKYCPADGLGCRDCDYGFPCDDCHYNPKVQLEYIELQMEKAKLITDKEYTYYIKRKNKFAREDA